MRLLLDTHTLLWWLAGDAALSPRAEAAIGQAENDILVSAASAWEISTKHRIGKLTGVDAIIGNLGSVISSQGFSTILIGFDHGITAGTLPGPHRDPFDRMLIAQAMIEDLVLVTNDAAFGAYAVKLLW